jgi:hypothetical protein
MPGSFEPGFFLRLNLKESRPYKLKKTIIAEESRDAGRREEKNPHP